MNIRVGKREVRDGVLIVVELMFENGLNVQKLRNDVGNKRVYGGRIIERK
jgi:hypothetical protein